jgi:uncharacterized repeat protein (TIGR01451 family)
MRARSVVPLVLGTLAVGAVPALAVLPPPPPPPPVTDLAIAKGADKGTYAPGETITYTITVANTGTTPVPRAAVLVSDPQLWNLEPADGGGKADDVLAPGDSLTWTGSRVASKDECGPVDNTATVALLGAKKNGLRDEHPANNTATHTVTIAGGACEVALSSFAKPVPAPSPSTTREAMPQSQGYVCPRPGLRARVTGPKSLTAGQSARFTVRVSNAKGSAAARRARVSMRLPSGFALASPVKSSAMKNGSMQMSIGTLKPRAARSWTVVLRADRTASGTKALSATVSASCGTARAKALVRVAQAVEQQVAVPVTG